MQTRTYSQLYSLITSLAGVSSFTSAEQTDILNFVNRRFYEAYSQSEIWPRYIVANEERTIIPTNTIQYTESGKNDIEEFIRIFRSQPFINNSSIEYEFWVDASGAHILNLVSTTDSSAFVTYKKSFPPPIVTGKQIFE